MAKKTQKKIVMLAIDSSTNKTGIAKFVNAKYENSVLLDCSKIKDPATKHNEMAKQILKVLDQTSPQIIYLEEMKVLTNMQTLRVLIRIQGIVMGWCLQNDCEFNLIAPTVWRKLLHFKQGKGIKGKQLKEQAISFVKEKFSINVNDDEAEAICIGIAAISMFDNTNTPQPLS